MNRRRPGPAPPTDLPATKHFAGEAITIAAPAAWFLSKLLGWLHELEVVLPKLLRAGDRDLLYLGRDATDAVLRFATRHQLRWHELNTIRVHALHQAENSDHGWTGKARILNDREMVADVKVSNGS